MRDRMEDLENFDRDGYDDDHEDAPIVNRSTARPSPQMAVANSMRPPPPPPPMTDEEKTHR